MKMHPEDFRRALEIITSNNRITVSFNTPVKDNYSNTHPILIHESKRCGAETASAGRLFALDDEERLAGR
mgnify:CR=1 FL=1|jgi:hypothetical protein